jgi:hypothetical protein
MSNYSDDDLYNMSDEQLEAAFRDAKVNLGTGDEISTEEVGVGTEEVSTESFDDPDNLNDSSESDQTSGETELVSTDEVDSETEASDPDGEVAEEEEQPTEEVEAGEVKPQPVHSYKANGVEYKFTQDEIMNQFPKIFGQAMDYTKKMQQIKPWRKTIDAIEQAQISHEDLSLAIDVLKGDKDAIAAVLKRTGVDTLDLDVDGSKYVPKSYGRDESTLNLKDVVDEISQDQEYATTSTILSKQWDDVSWKEMSSKPDMIKALHLDVKNGVYSNVAPIAAKMKVFDGGRKSDLEYYLEAGKEYYRELAMQEAAATRLPAQESKVVEQKAQKVAQVKQSEEKRKVTEQASAKRKAAAPTKPSSGKPQGVTDYLDDSDEAFEEWYKKLNDNA